ncbi:MAG: MarR family transcriptional regulator [Parachlamydiaceae bacterium]|nr:MarR family transcriptional regulator [Parachlamydiaceae bacterium]
MVSKENAKIEVSRLTSHIGFWMRLVSNNVSHAFADKLESSGVTVAEWVILREMYGVNDTTSVSRIAELSGLTRGAVSKLISRLLKKKLVTRKESIGDRRFQDIELTNIGIMLVPDLAILADQNDEEFFSILTKTEREALTALLKKIVNLHKFTTMPIN